MADKDMIPNLLSLAGNEATLDEAQHAAARKLYEHDKEIYPADGCAITLSTLLRTAGIDVADTFMAFDLGNVLKKRGWSVVPVGQQKAGDVGSTCGAAPHHGQDHIYLVLKPVNADEMIIADNQDARPHFRWASGAGRKTPTKFFLRAG